MTQEQDKREDAASQEGAASSPEESTNTSVAFSQAQDVPKSRTPLLVAMSCAIALVAGVGIWATGAAKDSAALTTVAKQESSVSGAATKTSTKASQSASQNSTTATSAAAPSAPQATPAASGPATAAAAAPQEKQPEPEPAPAAQEAPKETVTEVTTTTVPVSETPTETVVTQTEPAPAPEPEPVEEPTPEPEPEPTSVQVSVLVDGSAAGASVRNATVELAVGSSVYDALIASGANVNARGTVYGTYVAGIDGLAELEHGAMSGWVYAVNGVQPQTACSNYKLKDGDAVVWTYVNVE